MIYKVRSPSLEIYDQSLANNPLRDALKYPIRTMEIIELIQLSYFQGCSVHEVVEI